MDYRLRLIAACASAMLVCASPEASAIDAATGAAAFIEGFTKSLQESRQQDAEDRRQRKLLEYEYELKRQQLEDQQRLFEERQRQLADEQRQREQDAAQAAAQERQNIIDAFLRKQALEHSAAQERLRQGVTGGGTQEGKTSGNNESKAALLSSDKIKQDKLEKANERRKVVYRSAKPAVNTATSFKDCNDDSCPEMIVIPAGTHMLFGDRLDGSAVYIPSFTLGKTLVTQGQWKAIMGSNPSKFINCGDACPVESVSWNDAQEYLRRLSRKTGNNYRLPSEAEWEYACMAGQESEYCGGSNLDAAAWYGGNSGNTTHPVAGKQANRFGLYDMSGNVWELLQDCWGSDCRLRVVRGGSWEVGQQDLRAALRYRGNTFLRDSVTGFRIARTVQ